MKKIISVLLVLTMLLAPATAFAEEKIIDPDAPPILAESVNIGDMRTGILLVCGENMVEIFPDKEFTSPVNGFSVDFGKKSVTLDNVNDKTIKLYFFSMDEINVVVKGECAIQYINVYASKKPSVLRFKGSGTLSIVNDEQEKFPAVTMFADGTKSTVEIEKSVTLKTSGGYSFAVSGYGSKTDSDKIFTANGKSLDRIKSLTTYTVSQVKPCVYISKSETEVGARVVKDSDPDGIYGAQCYVTYPSMEKEYVVDRYVYSDVLGAYVIDDTFKSESLKPAAFKARGYTLFETIPENPVNIKYSRHTDSLGVTAGSGCEVIDPDDPDVKYVMSDNFYETAIYRYSLSKFEYDPDTKLYRKIKDYSTKNRSKFTDYGFTYVHDSSGKPVRITDADNTGAVIFRVTTPDDPDGVYGSGMSETEDDPEYTLRKLKYCAEHERYELDDSFAAKRYTKKQFEKTKLKYKADSYEPEMLALKYADISDGTVLRSGDIEAIGLGNSYYSENGEVSYNGGKLTVIKNNITLDDLDYENVTITKDFEYPAYYIKGNYEHKGVLTEEISSAKISGIKAKTYNGKAQTQSITVKDGTKTLKNGTDYTVSYKNNKNAGTATMTITGKGNYTGSVKKTFKINKANNPMTVTNKKTVNANSKKTTTIKAAVTVKKAQGAVTYKTDNKKVTVKNGTMTVAKGLKKGKTITVKVTVTAKGNSNYNKLAKTVSVKVKVK